MKKYLLASIILLSMFINNSNVFAIENNATCLENTDSVYYRWVAIMQIERNIGILVRDGTKERYSSIHTCGLPNVEYRDSILVLTYKNEEGKMLEVTDSLQAINIFDSLNLHYKSTITSIDANCIAPNDCGCWIDTWSIRYRLLELNKEAIVVQRKRLKK